MKGTHNSRRSLLSLREMSLGALVERLVELVEELVDLQAELA